MSFDRYTSIALASSLESNDSKDDVLLQQRKAPPSRFTFSSADLRSSLRNNTQTWFEFDRNFAPLDVVIGSQAYVKKKLNQLKEEREFFEIAPAVQEIIILVLISPGLLNIIKNYLFFIENNQSDIDLVFTVDGVDPVPRAQQEAKEQSKLSELLPHPWEVSPVQESPAPISPVFLPVLSPEAESQRLWASSQVLVRRSIYRTLAGGIVAERNPIVFHPETPSPI